MFNFKTVSFTLTMAAMTFGAATTKAFHSDWYDGDHSYAMDADLFEHQGAAGPFECPGMANSSKDLVAITEALYGSADEGDFNPFLK